HFAPSPTEVLNSLPAARRAGTPPRRGRAPRPDHGLEHHVGERAHHNPVAPTPVLLHQLTATFGVKLAAGIRRDWRRRRGIRVSPAPLTSPAQVAARISSLLAA